MRELRVLDVADKFFYCLTATIEGSSGAPLFNGQWELVGMHRASARPASGAALGAGEAGIIMEVVRPSRIISAVRARKLSGHQLVLAEEMLYVQPQTGAVTTT